MKKIIKPLGYNDKTISIALKSSQEGQGGDESVRDYIDKEVQANLPKPVDRELVRYKPSFSGEISIKPLFKPDNTNTYSLKGFKKQSVNELLRILKNSIYILEYYDGYNDDAKLLSMSYVRADNKEVMTRSGDVCTANLRFKKQSITPEFNIVYIPAELYHAKETTMVYLKISFFNAKTGRISTFSFSDVTNTRYQPILLDHTNKTYNFHGISSVSDPKEVITTDKDEISLSTNQSGKSVFGDSFNGTGNPFLDNIIVNISLRRGQLTDLLLPTFDELGNENRDYLTWATITSPSIYNGMSYTLKWGMESDVVPVRVALQSVRSGVEKVYTLSTAPDATKYQFNYNSGDFTFGVYEYSLPGKVVLTLSNDPSIRKEISVTLNRYHRNSYVFDSAQLTNQRFTIDAWEDGAPIRLTWGMNSGINYNFEDSVVLIGVYQDSSGNYYGTEFTSGLVGDSYHDFIYSSSMVMMPEWESATETMVSFYLKDPLFGEDIHTTRPGELFANSVSGVGYTSVGIHRVAVSSSSGGGGGAPVGGGTGGATTGDVYNNPHPTSYSGPIVITVGGTYTGNWESTNENTPAVHIATNEPVKLINCNIRANGWGISATGTTGVDLTVLNCRHFGGALSNKQRRFIDGIGAFKNLRVENCYMESSAGIKMAGGYSGNGTPSQTLTIRYNKAYNIDSRTLSGRINSQFFQCDGLKTTTIYKSVNGVDYYQGIPYMEIAWNEVINRPGLSDVEDNINIYNSRGTSASPMKIHNNFIYGAYYWNWAGENYTGSGMICDSPGTNAGSCSAYVDFEDNIVLMSNGATFGVAGGNHVNMRRNIGVSKSVIDNEDATRLGVTGAGTELRGYPASFYVDDNRYKMNSTFNNTVVDHIEGIVGEKNISIGYWRNDYTNNANTTNPDWVTVTNLTSLPNPINRGKEDEYKQLWNNRIVSASKRIGVIVE